MPLDSKQKQLLKKLRGQASNFKKYQQKTVLSKLNDLDKDPTETTKATTDEAGTINPQFPTNAVMLSPPQSIETKIKMFQRAIDPQDLHGKGLELSPHVTVWHGGDISLPAYHFMEQVKGQTPFYVDIVGMGVFERPNFDVLYIGVESSDLRELNARFNNLRESERNIFVPHITVAYLKPGLAQKYLVDLFPYTSQFRVSGMTFSSEDRQKMDMFFNRRQLNEYIPTIKASKIGPLIKRLRQEKDMTLTELAAKLPITASTLGAIKRGDIETPSKPVIDAAAKALGVTTSRLTGQLPEGAKPADNVSKNKAASLMVFTDKEGRSRWLSVSSTAFKDRDREIVSTKSLGQAVQIGDMTNERGPLRFWHMPGVDLGDCDFQMLQGNMLIESGTFRSKEYAVAVERVAPSMGVSLGFKHPITEPDTDGTFNNIFIYERSILPAHKAANPFTSITLKDTDMTTQAEKQAVLIDMLGEGVASAFLDQATKADKSLVDAGIAHKEVSDMTPDELRAFAKDVQLLADEKEAEAEKENGGGEGRFVTRDEFNKGIQKILFEVRKISGGNNATKEAQAAIDDNVAKLKAQQESLQKQLAEIAGNASKSASYRATRDGEAMALVAEILKSAGSDNPVPATIPANLAGVYSDFTQNGQV